MEKNVRPVTIKRVENIARQHAATVNGGWEAICEQSYYELLPRKHGIVHTTIPDEKHKLAGGTGINTPVRNNPICAARRAKAIEEEDFDCVCIGCYADNLTGCYPDLEKALEYNQYILTHRILTREEILQIPIWTLYLREEMFGDVTNLIQAINYIHIAEYRPDKVVAVWSKNHNIYYHAFQKCGKPANLCYVYSSVHLDVLEDIPDFIAPYVDHRFTVCRNEETYKRLLQQVPNSRPCAGISCFKPVECGGCGAVCYHKNQFFDLIELQRLPGGNRKKK